MLSAALTEIARDRACFGAPSSVYLWLLTHLLDVESFRPVKVAGVAAGMGVSAGTVRRALELLEQRGYLQRESRPDDVSAYRIRWTKLPSAAAPATSAASEGQGITTTLAASAPRTRSEVLGAGAVRRWTLQPPERGPTAIPKPK